MTTLKSLIDETTNIKDELKTCHINLVNNLSAKGVEVSSGDNLGDLVDKVENIDSAVKTIASDNIIFSDEGTSRGASTSYIEAFRLVSTFIGSIRCSCYFSKNESGTGYLNMSVTRNGEIIDEYEFTHGSTSEVNYSYDFNNIEIGDIIIIKWKTSRSTTSYIFNVRQIKLGGDIV